MPRQRRKSDLPTKTCATCGRPFTWRRKWAKDWETVRYCSTRCRNERPRATSQRLDELSAKHRGRIEGGTDARRAIGELRDEWR